MAAQPRIYLDRIGIELSLYVTVKRVTFFSRHCYPNWQKNVRAAKCRRNVGRGKK